MRQKKCEYCVYNLINAAIVVYGGCELLDHYRKMLIEQIDILESHRTKVEDMDTEFVRIHSQSIVSLCDHMLVMSSSRGCPGSFGGPSFG